MIVDVEVPSVGESITEGVLVEWVAEDGQVVDAEDPLYVLETDKVTMTINAQQAGRIKIVVPEEEVVKIGQVVAKLDTDAEPEPAASEPEPQEEQEQAGEAPAREAETAQSSEKEGSAARMPAGKDTPAKVPQSEGPPLNAPAGMPQAKEKAAARAESDELSPAVRRMVAEFHLDPAAIPGSGKDGRITKEDVVRYMDQQEKEARPQPAPQAAQEAAAKPEEAPRKEAPRPAPEPAREPGERQSRVRMTPFRQRAAERLVLSQQSTATLTTFNEVDMTRIMALREQYKGLYQEKYGVKLGFMSFFLKAAVDALKTVPEVNASIQGDEIVVNHFFDIGVAVGTDHGLVVPVVRDVDKLSFADLEAAVHELARKAQEKSLTLADLSGGVFTVSNGGVYGNLLSTPILNPPQSAILGMHAIKKRPVAVGDELALRPMMYVAMSYDHRLVDGREAVTFLKRIVECIENPERMMLEI